jgi:hypothetical protein
MNPAPPHLLLARLNLSPLPPVKLDLPLDCLPAGRLGGRSRWVEGWRRSYKSRPPTASVPESHAHMHSPLLPPTPSPIRSMHPLLLLLFALGPLLARRFQALVRPVNGLIPVEGWEEGGGAWRVAVSTKAAEEHGRRSTGLAVGGRAGPDWGLG